MAMNKKRIKMNIFLKIVGYVLLAINGLEIVYIVFGQPYSRQVHTVQDTLWHLISAVGLFALGIYLVIRKPQTVQVTEPKSQGFGIASLTVSIIGILWWPAVLGIIAIILAILQFRKNKTKIAFAGLIIGVLDYLQAGIGYYLGLSQSIF